jgi:asparagine synthase (glutamine-hydrolysing)
MCGILGGWFHVAYPFEHRVRAGMQALKHRGPDDDDKSIFPVQSGNVVLGHTRLAILDLSPQARQPMRSACGRYTIVFNGEIYNYRELREELTQKNHHFHTQSDTEVLLAAWSEWQERCLERLLGMFAMVIYDQHQQTLMCVRDAFGIKPFFYCSGPDHFLFASEQPALLALRDVPIRIDWQRSYDFLVFGDYDSQSRTFIDGIQHLQPGHCLSYNIKDATLNVPQSWWTPRIQEASQYNFDQAVESVRDQFLQMVRLHLRSDVPLGVALSGGIDSSAIACAIRHVEPDYPIHTFSFIAQDSAISEESWVDHVNQHIQAIPHKITVTSQNLAHDLDDLIRSQGEPFGSTSIYAQYSVFKRVREMGITVTLDGQGADELLGGYSGYPGERMLSLLENGQWLQALQFYWQWGRGPGRRYRDGLKSFGAVTVPQSLYKLASHCVGRNASPPWLNTNLLQENGVWLREKRIPKSQFGYQRRVMEHLAHALQVRSLPALLRHGDRNSMRFSVESRVPFLTLPMANLLLSLPEQALINQQGITKHIFRKAMRGIVPDKILDRRDKIGFATPEKDWLLSMTPVVRGWLQESQNVPFINHQALLRTFDQVANGKIPYSWQVWRWINFIRWYTHIGAPG